MLASSYKEREREMSLSRIVEGPHWSWIGHRGLSPIMVGCGGGWLTQSELGLGRGEGQCVLMGINHFTLHKAKSNG